jgi:hypothetical protein
MSDMRLIDANALPNYKFNVTIEVGEHKGPAEIRVAFWEDVKNAPTIDAVPVVRCRECKYAEKTVWSSGEMYCRVWKMNPRPDGFCHMGAKMDAKDIDVPTKDGGCDEKG